MSEDESEPDVGGTPADEIALRVPGPWASPEAFDRALPDGYRLGGDGERVWLYTPPDELGATPGRVPLYVHPHDAEFVEFFTGGTGRPIADADRAGIERHATLVCPVFPGGSPARAAAALTHVAALIRAGGHGVFVDNCGIAHGSHDWLDLARDADDGGLFWAFVNTYRADDRLSTIGGHVLGHRDATLVGRSGDDVADEFALRNFLSYAMYSGATIGDGEHLNDVAAAGGVLVATLVDDDEVPAGHPMHNPFGRYRLERDAGVDPRSPFARGPA